MLTYEEMEHNPVLEDITQILCSKTQNDNPLFFRVLVAYYFGLIASMMRTNIITHDRGEIPINIYALNLSPSGTGKGLSTNILEEEIVGGFKRRFLEETFPDIAEQHLPKLAKRRAARSGSDPDDELLRTQKEFDDLGPLVFTFDSGTPAAIKQMRHKLLMADGGAMNLHIDEIGSNLISNIDVLNTFLELYDVGKIKQKLIKNTLENRRNEEIDGKTPTNMMLFGTPAKLLNGGKTEEELYSMLETGYARRCFFGYSKPSNRILDLTPEEVYDKHTDPQHKATIDALYAQMEDLADILNVGRKLTMDKDTALLFIEYRLNCERLAAEFPDHDEIKKSELSHRYYKALKLAGAYAFIEDSDELTIDNAYQAIKLAEESGEAFQQLLTRDRSHVKLAKYLASIKKPVTQADLVEDLPFYRGSMAAKQEMLTLASAWGYQNNIIIKKAYTDGIEFLRGESIEETDLNRMILSYSRHYAENYRNGIAPFNDLHTVMTHADFHWVNHHLIDGADGKGVRREENVIPQFNMIVLDVENGSTTLDQAKELLKDYKFFMYATKSNTPTDPCFRMVIPINYTLKLDAKEYKEFMNNIYEWLPFEVDTQTNQRARKWASHDSGEHYYNDGIVLDVLSFIPKTSKNEERKRVLESQQDLDNLERWVINNIGDGNRNNMLLRYAMLLVESGATMLQIQEKVFALNEKIPDKLDATELLNTVLTTVKKKLEDKA